MQSEDGTQIQNRERRHIDNGVMAMNSVTLILTREPRRTAKQSTLAI